MIFACCSRASSHRLRYYALRHSLFLSCPPQLPLLRTGVLTSSLSTGWLESMRRGKTTLHDLSAWNGHLQITADIFPVAIFILSFVRLLLLLPPVYFCYPNPFVDAAAAAAATCSLLHAAPATLLLFLPKLLML